MATNLERQADWSDGSRLENGRAMSLEGSTPSLSAQPYQQRQRGHGAPVGCNPAAQEVRLLLLILRCRRDRCLAGFHKAGLSGSIPEPAIALMVFVL